MQRAVRKVVEHVLKDEKEGDLAEHEVRRGEGHRVRREAKVLGERVEAPDLGELDGKVREEDRLGALPHLLLGGDLGLATERGVSEGYKRRERDGGLTGCSLYLRK